MTLPGRSGSLDSYRYGFQGQEKDDEIKGEGNSYNYTFRMHDSRVGRFLSLDPLESSFPWNSPYAFAENRVIDGVELEGLEFVFASDGKLIGKFGKSNNIKVASNIQYELYEKGTLNIEELAHCTTNINKTTDEVKSNIYTTIYVKEVRNKRNKYKLFKNKIGVGKYNLPSVNEMKNEKRDGVLYTSAEAQTFIFEDSNTAALHFWSSNYNDYYDIATSINHEHGHAYNELEVNKEQSTAGQYEAIIYWHEIDSENIYNNLTDKSKYIARKKFVSNLSRLLSRGTQNSPKPESQINKDAQMFVKYRKLYEDKFNTVLKSNGFGGVYDEKNTKPEPDEGG